MLVFTDHRPLISAMALHSLKNKEREIIKWTFSVDSSLNIDAPGGPRTRLMTIYQ